MRLSLVITGDTINLSMSLDIKVRSPKSTSEYTLNLWISPRIFYFTPLVPIHGFKLLISVSLDLRHIKKL